MLKAGGGVVGGWGGDQRSPRKEALETLFEARLDDGSFIDMESNTAA